MIGIYKIQNLINGKVYIGQSKNISSRWRQHRYLAKIEDTYLYRSMRKYGIENFSFEVIEECSLSSLNVREEFWIHYYESTKPEKGYNILSSSDNLYDYNTKLNQSDIDTIYELLMNTKIPQEEIAKQFNVNQAIISRINIGELHIKENISYPLRSKKQINYCANCGNEISRGAIYCFKCSSLMKRTKERPTRGELKNLIRVKSFVEIGRIFGVSDNAIRKWCKAYDLPSKKTDIKRYSDEEWELV